MPLTMRQIYHQNEAASSGQLPTTRVSITSDIFSFLGYEGAPRIQQLSYQKLLHRAEIPFKQITFDDQDADAAVKEDGLKLTE